MSYEEDRINAIKLLVKELDKIKSTELGRVMVEGIPSNESIWEKVRKLIRPTSKTVSTGPR